MTMRLPRRYVNSTETIRRSGRTWPEIVCRAFQIAAGVPFHARQGDVGPHELHGNPLIGPHTALKSTPVERRVPVHHLLPPFPLFAAGWCNAC